MLRRRWSASCTVRVAKANCFIHPKHLNTPRLVADATGTTVWRWDQADPFGNNPADENPSGLGAFDLPLRLPGQYFDPETGGAQNWHRDYSQEEGRYRQFDPIGLWGGINGYQYALASPLSYFDRLGLNVKVCFYADAAAGFGHVGYGSPQEQRTRGYYPTGNPLESPGIVKEDTQQQQACKVIESPPEKDECMRRCRSRRENDPGMYYLTFNQCTSYVRDCLKECGLPYGNYAGPRPKPFFQGLPGK